jgi:AcrR family transcriptional regulator
VTTERSGRQVGLSRPEEIREVALTLFAERGYTGTSMKDIANVLGIRAPTLYNHLDSKQDLLREVLVTTIEGLIRVHREAIATTADVREQVRRAMEAHVAYHAQHRREVRIASAEIASLEEPARGEVLALHRTYAGAWQELVERGVAEGRFQVPWPEVATYALLELGTGLSLWSPEDGPLSPSQIAYCYGDMALRLVGAEGAEPAGPPPAPAAAPAGRRA